MFFCESGVMKNLSSTPLSIFCFNEKCLLRPFAACSASVEFDIVCLGLVSVNLQNNGYVYCSVKGAVSMHFN